MSSFGSRPTSWWRRSGISAASTQVVVLFEVGVAGMMMGEVASLWFDEQRRFLRATVVVVVVIEEDGGDRDVV